MPRRKPISSPTSRPRSVAPAAASLVAWHRPWPPPRRFHSLTPAALPYGLNSTSGKLFGNVTFSRIVSPVLRPLAQFLSRNGTSTPSTFRKSA